MTGRLVPTRRADKNGKIVTRHVKPQDAVQDRTPLPVPVLAAPDADSHEELVSSTAQIIFSIIIHKYPGRNPDIILDAIKRPLTRYSPVTVERIRAYEWNVETANTLTLGISYRWDETLTNDYMAVSEVIREEEPDGVPPLYYSQWKHYRSELHPENNNGDYPQERLNQLTAIYRVTKLIASSDSYWAEPEDETETVYIDSDELRQLILNPGPQYTRDEVVSVILDHDTLDAGRVKKILDLGVSPMSGGVL